MIPQINHCILKAGGRVVVKGTDFLKVPKLHTLQKQTSYDFTRIVGVQMTE